MATIKILKSNYLFETSQVFLQLGNLCLYLGDGESAQLQSVVFYWEVVCVSFTEHILTGGIFVEQDNLYIKREYNLAVKI